MECYSFRNNIFYGINSELIFHNGYMNIQGKTDTTFNYQSNSDNYFAKGPIFTVKKIHGQYDCTSITDVDSLQNLWRRLTKSNQINIVNPLSYEPGFVDEINANLALLRTSNLIEQGKIVPGFYDYVGRQPDIGANESSVDSTLSIFTLDFLSPSSFSVWPVPFDNQITVSNYPYGSKIKIYDAAGKLWYSSLPIPDPYADFNPFQKGYEQISTKSFPDGVYIIKVGWVQKKIVKFSMNR